MTKSVKGHQIIQVFEEFSPKKLAMEGDPVGLHIGTLRKPIKKVMIALDVLDAVADEAISKGIDLIIAHHPLIYRPLKRLITDEPGGRLIEKLIKNDIAVYTAHTNLDVAEGGVNDLLAEALGLINPAVLVPTSEQRLKKLAVFVPEENAGEMYEALGKAGAGSIGDYSHCTFTSAGTGRFLPGEEANPHIGKPGELEIVDEVKIETVFPEHLETRVVSAMLKTHPYEEPAFDLYPLAVKGQELGLGRVGELPREMSLEEFAAYVKEAFQVDGVRVVGNLDDRIKKVAVLGGDGNKYFAKAKMSGADVYVTGDFYYHTAHDALNMGLNVVDPGHHIEQIMKQGIARKMQELCSGRGYDVEFTASSLRTDPFIFM